MPRSLRSSAPKKQPAGVAITVKITNQLLPLLESRGLSQAECAKRICLSPQQFGRIIKGAVPKLDIVAALETVLGADDKEIFPRTVQTRRVR